MARGGARPGAGRPKGAESPKTRTRRELMAAGISPLDVMLETMRERWEADDKAGACAIAKDAAPYVHPRLASTQVKGELSITDALAERLARARERLSE